MTENSFHVSHDYHKSIIRITSDTTNSAKTVTKEIRLDIKPITTGRKTELGEQGQLKKSGKMSATLTHVYKVSVYQLKLVLL